VLELKVIECDESQERVVFSERAALAGEGCRKRLFSELVEGDIVCGTVTNITDFGAFIDLGGVEGLIHVSELSWGRVRHPQEVLTLGQTIDAQVLHISEKDERVALSYKRQFHNPWSDILEIFQPGMVTDAIITTITRYGAFARLKDGIEGLIHISSIFSDQDKPQYNDRMIHDILEPGQQVQVKILHIDIGRRRLGLELLDPE
jgi:small subunit ribosomal protein S1